MTPELRQRANRVLEGALGRPADERGHFLHEACGGDAELRGLVESLLAHADSASRDGFLIGPAPVNAQAASVKPTAILVGPAPATPSRATANGPAVALPLVPGFDVLGLLGEGGMGVVYKARQNGLNRLVALKMIRGGALARPEDVNRFRAEAEAVARLQHPNIVQIFEIGERAGLPYFALEYVDGGCLDRKIAGRPQPPRYAAALVQALARAVHAAHQQGVVHRDLKPANVLLTSRGTPKITDFGLAKLEEDRGQTRTGAIMGTPSYMAPEQASGNPRAVGPAVDVYALGAILYELLTGRPPFRGANPLETLEQVRRQDPVPPRRLQLDVPVDLETICLKCLAKEPPQRYASAEELADELRRFLGGEPIRARPMGPAERLARALRRRRAAVLWSAASAAAVILAVVITVRLVWRDRPEPEQVVVPGPAPDAPPELLRYKGHTGWVMGVAFSGDGRRALTGAGGAIKDGKQVLGDDCTVRLWDLNTGEQLRRFAGHAYPVTSVAFADGEKHVYSADMGGEVRQWDADGGEAVRRLRVWQTTWPNVINFVAFSPGSGRVLSCFKSSAVLWDLATGQRLRAFEGHTGNVTATAFSPDGRRVVTGGEDRTVRVWDAQTGQQLRQFVRHAQPVMRVAFSPDGRTVASAGLDGSLWLSDAQTGEPLRRCQGETTMVTSLDFSADGGRLLTGSLGAGLCLWEVGSGKSVRALEGPMALINVALSPDGRRALSASQDTTFRLWDVEAGREVARFGDTANLMAPGGAAPDGAEEALPPEDSGREVCRFAGHENYVYAVAFSPDGRRVLTGGGGVHKGPNNEFLPGTDRAVRIWDLATRKELPRLEGHTHAVIGAAFSPSDGKTVATASWDGSVRLWNSETGQEVGRLRRHTAGVEALAFTGDGRRLVSGGADGRAILWDVAAARELRRFEGHTGNVMGVAISRDGRRVVTGSDDETWRVWDAETGQPLKTVASKDGPVRAVALAPDGGRVLTGCKGSDVRLWDVEKGTEVRNLRGHDDEVWAVAFSADGKRALSGSNDCTVRLWDVEQGRQLLVLEGHAHHVMGVAFSPDGTQALSASLDRTARLWQLDDAPERIRKALNGSTDRLALLAVFGPNATLEQALDDLGKKHDVRIEIDEDAFREKGARDVRQTPVELPRLRKVRVGTVLDLLTDQVSVPGPGEDGEFVQAVWAIKGDRVVVSPGRPRVSTDESARSPLTKVLARRVTLPGTDDPQLTLREALDYFSDRFALNLVISRRLFKLVGQQDVEARPVQIDKADNVPLGVVLRSVLSRAGANAMIRSDHILIVPRRDAAPPEG
jgi:WD40 repeat protein